MHLIIDGYNLLLVGRSQIRLDSIDLLGERDRLVGQLARYRQTKPCDITVVFDGWQGGWSEEKKERKKGIELIFSKRGEKADEVVKRLIRETGSGATVITSDREISNYANRLAATVIPSDQFRKKMEIPPGRIEKDAEEDEERDRGMKRKGPSRRLSKKERRMRTALKKL